MAATNEAAGKAVVKRHKKMSSDDRWGYAFVAVAVIFFCLFTIYPLISAVITSFENYKPFGSEFVGFDNYIKSFTNDLFWKSMKNTLI